MNDRIRASEVRLIDESGRQAGIVSIREALALADKVNLDLVEVSPNTSPVVCRIMDYGKYVFSLKKKETAVKKKQKQIQIKEVKFRPVTEEADYQVKLRRIKGFLEDGNKAKVTLRFRGREITHKEIGLDLLNRLGKDLEDSAVVETTPKNEGRLQFMVVFAPKSKKDSKK